MNKKNIYFKVIILTIIMTVIAFAAFKNFEKFFSTNITHVMSYTNDSSVDYKVKLKKNDYYEDKYLKKGYLYIATLIDDIDLNFNYKFHLEKKAKINYKYKLVATVIVKGDNTEDLLYEKKYVLKDIKENNVEGSQYIINEPLTIKYNDYNKIIKDFKKEYALNSNSELKLSLIVNTNVDSEEFKNKKSANDTVDVKIPLTEQTINISVDTDNQTSIGHFSEDSNNNLINYAYLFVFILLLSITAIIIIQIFKLLKKTEPENYIYFKKINNITKQYDRFIVNVDKLPELEKITLFDVDTFEELLDARDNLQRPILYKELIHGEKSCFIIINNNEAYRYIADINQMKKNSKKKNK